MQELRTPTHTQSEHCKSPDTKKLKFIHTLTNTHLTLFRVLHHWFPKVLLYILQFIGLESRGPFLQKLVSTC